MIFHLIQWPTVMFFNVGGGRGRLIGGSMLRMRTSSIKLSQCGLLGDRGDITKTLRKAIQWSSLSSLSNGAANTKTITHSCALMREREGGGQFLWFYEYLFGLVIFSDSTLWESGILLDFRALYILNSLFKKCFNFDVGCSSRTVITAWSPVFFVSLSKLRTKSIRAW